MWPSSPSSKHGPRDLRRPHWGPRAEGTLGDLSEHLPATTKPGPRHSSDRQFLSAPYGVNATQGAGLAEHRGRQEAAASSSVLQEPAGLRALGPADALPLTRKEPSGSCARRASARQGGRGAGRGPRGRHPVTAAARAGVGGRGEPGPRLPTSVCLPKGRPVPGAKSHPLTQVTHTLRSLHAPCYTTSPQK